MSFFKNYSQNGAAQAIVVLSAFTVAAEVFRSRSTGKRPYRDYGVGGMNENGSRMMFPPPSWMDQANRDEGGVPHDMDDRLVDSMAGPAMHGTDDDRRGASMDYMIARNEISSLGRRLREDADRLMQEEGMTEEEAAEILAVRQQARNPFVQTRQSRSEGAHHQMGHHQASHQAGRQQMGHEQTHAQHEDIEGSMARAPSRWNRYVATEVPRLMAEGKTAAQAMKAASLTFRTAPRAVGGLGEPRSVKSERKPTRAR